MINIKKRNKHLFLRKVCAFTLSEVLIAIALIGVIAAIMVPQVVVTYKQQETVELLKKAYSELSQAVRLSEMENGPISTWNFKLSSKDFSEQYLRPFVKINKSKAKYTTYRYLNGSIATSAIFKVAAKNGDATDVFTTVGGATYFIDAWYEEDMEHNIFARGIGVDINGTGRKPNVIGRDFFYLMIDSEAGGVTTAFRNVKTRREILSNYCSKTQTHIDSSMGCAKLIQMDGYNISSDYPW
jgi:prepilin-type N-terminal cleavage/methylation domain-containing protein